VTALAFPSHYHPASAPYTHFCYLLPTLCNFSNFDDKLKVDELEWHVACMGGVRNAYGF
jgi:hypothetical protein